MTAIWTWRQSIYWKGRWEQGLEELKQSSKLLEELVEREKELRKELEAKVVVKHKEVVKFRDKIVYLEKERDEELRKVGDLDANDLHDDVVKRLRQRPAP